MIRQNELMNVRCSERGSLLGIKIYSPSSECLIECVDIPEQPGLDIGLRMKLMPIEKCGWLKKREIKKMPIKNKTKQYGARLINSTFCMCFVYISEF